MRGQPKLHRLAMRMSTREKQMLRKIAEINHLSITNMVNFLIWREAERLGLATPMEVADGRTGSADVCSGTQASA